MGSNVMAYFEWDDSMAVGVPLVDHDHKLLVRLINQLHGALEANEERGTIGTVLNALVDYTRHHFHREEMVMAACRYGDLADHVREHTAFTDEIGDIEHRYRSGDDDALGSRLLEYLKDWLVGHILQRDKVLSGVVADHPHAVTVAEQVPRLTFDRGVAAAPSHVDWRSLRVLVVDDNPNFRRIMATILETVQIGKVREAATGMEALGVIERGNVDVVVCDWLMDGMDGMVFLEAVAEAKSPPPVVILTGFGDKDFTRKAKARGAAGVLEKPIAARDVLMTIAGAAVGRA